MILTICALNQVFTTLENRYDTTNHSDTETTGFSMRSHVQVTPLGITWGALRKFHVIIWLQKQCHVTFCESILVRVVSASRAACSTTMLLAANTCTAVVQLDYHRHLGQWSQWSMHSVIMPSVPLCSLPMSTYLHYLVCLDLFYIYEPAKQLHLLGW